MTGRTTNCMDLERSLHLPFLSRGALRALYVVYLWGIFELFVGKGGVLTFLTAMSSEEAKLEEINALLGNDIAALLKEGNAKLFFESNAEAKKNDKTRKLCIVYIIGEYLLICRPRKYGKKYYVKYQLRVSDIHVVDDPSQYNVDGSTPPPRRDASSPVIISARNHFNLVDMYYIW